MNNNCCLAGRLFLPLLLLGGNVLAMDEREAVGGGGNDWSSVSAPPPPGPYRSVNIDPRIPGQDAVSVPGVSQDVRIHSQLPAESLRMPPAAGGAAPQPTMPGGVQPQGPDPYYERSSRTREYAPPPRPRPLPRDYAPAPAQLDYATPRQSEGYAPPGPYEYAQPGRANDYGQVPPDFDQSQRSADTIPPPPGTQEDYARQPLPGPYGRNMQRPPTYNYPGPDHYPRQPVQQDYRRPPPGYYSPSTQRPLKEAPQPPIYDSMMVQPSGGSANEDASAGVPQ